MTKFSPVLVSAILTGAWPPGVDGSSDDGDDGGGGLGVADDPMITTELTRDVARNGTSIQKLETGAIVSIALGGTAVLILFAGLVWWYCMRKEPPAWKRKQPTFVAFNAPAGMAGCDPQVEVEMPLLRLSTAANGAK